MRTFIKYFNFCRDQSGFFCRCFWLYLVIAVILLGMIDKDRVCLNRLNVLKDSEYDLEMFSQGRGKLNENTLRWAVRYYSALRKYAPEISLYYGDLGFCYFYLGQDDQAIKAYQKAIELEPQLYMYHYDLGMIYQRLGRLDKAVDCLFSALAHINRSVQYFSKTAEFLQKYNGQDFSAVAANLIERAHTDEENILLRLTEILTGLKDYARLATVAEQGLQTQSKSYKLYYRAGWAEYMLGHYDRAVAYLTKSIELDPRFPDARYYRGLVLKKAGQTAAGNADLMQAKSLQNEGYHDAHDDNDIKLHLNIELRILRQHF